MTYWQCFLTSNLRAAHDHNDEVLESIYIGRRFRSDTERLEKLFAMYTKLTTKVSVLALPGAPVCVNNAHHPPTGGTNE